MNGSEVASATIPQIDARHSHADTDEETGALLEPAVHERRDSEPQDGDFAQAQKHARDVELPDLGVNAHKDERDAHQRGRHAQYDANVHLLNKLARHRGHHGHRQIQNGDVEREGSRIDRASGGNHAHGLRHDRLEVRPRRKRERRAPEGEHDAGDDEQHMP